MIGKLGHSGVLGLLLTLLFAGGCVGTAYRREGQLPITKE